MANNMRVLNRPHSWKKIYTAGEQQQQLAKDKFSRTDSQISVAFMLEHISVALLPISVSFSSRVKFFPSCGVFGTREYLSDLDMQGFFL